MQIIPPTLEGLKIWPIWICNSKSLLAFLNDSVYSVH